MLYFFSLKDDICRDTELVFANSDRQQIDKPSTAHSTSYLNTDRRARELIFDNEYRDYLRSKDSISYQNASRSYISAGKLSIGEFSKNAYASNN